LLSVHDVVAPKSVHEVEALNTYLIPESCTDINEIR